MTDTLVAGSPAPAADEPRPGSVLQRIVDTFFSPGALFRRFGARPPWVDVMILSVALGALAFALIPLDVWVATTEEAMRRQGGNAPAMDPEQVAGMQRVFGLIGAVIMPWIMLVIQAGLMVLLFTVILGGRATFRQYVSVVAHASLIGALGTLASLPIMIQKESMQAGITLGALVGGMDHDSFVYQFLNGFNVFYVWQFVVMGIGVAALNRKIGAGTAVGVLLGLYAVIAATVAAIF